MAWTDGRCSNCGAMLTTGGCPFCARPTLIVTVTGHTEYVDPRDAEIARLKAEVAALRVDHERAIGTLTVSGVALDVHSTMSMTTHVESVVSQVRGLLRENQALRLDLARHKRALAAGPAALRRFGFDGYELAAFDAEIARLKAEVAVRDGSWCEQNRKEGRGGCGMCAWCCKDAREQRDALALDLAAHKRALAAGPAALRRAEMTLYRWDAAEVVEAAPEAAMKEGK